MAKDTGFLELGRQTPPLRPPAERIQDFDEHYARFDEQQACGQASRCMDCGVPFCHQGCPLGNRIPEFNQAVYEQQWQRAYEILSETNNFPEFTGRICPAPCEASCVLSLHNEAVSIEYIEKEIAERAWEAGWVAAGLPQLSRSQAVAIVGSGPAGLAAADQLNRLGYRVHVYERDDRPGGLLMYGIPDYKLSKQVVQRRIEWMRAAGITFHCGIALGQDLSLAELRESFDAVVLAIGARLPRDLPIEGRQLKGVHFAMDFLTQSNRRNQGDVLYDQHSIFCAGEDVLVIGGGDTGSDCIGTAIRQAARSVVQITLEEQPPGQRAPDNPWPEWPRTFRTSSSHEEGCERYWALNTQAFLGDETGHLRAVRVEEVRWEKQASGSRWLPVAGTAREIPCTRAFIAIGFASAEQQLLSDNGLQTDIRGNIQAARYATNLAGVFAAGDARRGQSLVVWAIAEGRQAAEAVHRQLSQSVRTYHTTDTTTL